jgi:hypothetical protein
MMDFYQLREPLAMLISMFMPKVYAAMGFSKNKGRARK